MKNYFRNLVAGLSERERRLAMFAGGFFLIFMLFLAAFLVRTNMSSLKDDNLETAELLRLLAEEGPAFRQRKVSTARGNKRTIKPTPLRTLVDKIGRELDVTVPDIKELPAQGQGTSWLVKGVEVSMRRIGIQDLTDFMEMIEGNRKKFPIAISKLEIRKRKRAPDAYDVKMVISTYEQTTPIKSDSRRSKKSSSKGGRP